MEKREAYWSRSSTGAGHFEILIDSFDFFNSKPHARTRMKRE
jgi:hypothetical protein